MARGKRLAITPEEKIAKKIGKELSDFTLDLEAIGKYLSLQPYIIFSRIMEILESAEYNRNENKYDDQWKTYNDKF